MNLAAILGALGLSGAAGLNAYIPLLVVASLERLGVVHLAAPYDVLARAPVLIALVLLLVIEMIVDKVPGADHVNDIVQTFVRPAAGAVLFAANTGMFSSIHPAIPVLCGLVIAFGVHATKAAARPVVTTATLGFGTPVVSVLEDCIAFGTSLAAVFLPIVIAGFALLFGWGAYWVWSRRRRRSTAPTGRAPRAN